jgi:hypothetical protein
VRGANCHTSKKQPGSKAVEKSFNIHIEKWLNLLKNRVTS